MSSWRTRANCKGVDPSIFITRPRGDRYIKFTDKEMVDAALSICDECPVKQPCLETSKKRSKGDYWEPSMVVGGQPDRVFKRVFHVELNYDNTKSKGRWDNKPYHHSYVENLDIQDLTYWDDSNIHDWFLSEEPKEHWLPYRSRSEHKTGYETISILEDK